jgi:ribosome recycling factor
MKLLGATVLLFSASVSVAFTPNSSFGFRAITNPQQSAQIQYNHVVQSRSQTVLSMAFESTEEVEMDVEERFGKCLESLKRNLQTIRTGRANPSILDLVQVSYYGADTPLNQMASISVPNSQQLVVEPFDKSIIGDVEKAIMESGLGLTPNNDGSTIRINIPTITEERRKELLKQCKAMGEDGKVSIRNVRRDGVDAVKKMEKAGDIGEDESKGSQDEIQKITDKFVKSVTEIVDKKEKDVMTV